MVELTAECDAITDGYNLRAKKFSDTGEDSVLCVDLTQCYQPIHCSLAYLFPQNCLQIQNLCQHFVNEAAPSAPWHRGVWRQEL